MKPKCPCKDCEKRKLLCHSACSEYKAFKDEVQKNNEARQRERAKHSIPERNRNVFKRWIKEL